MNFGYSPFYISAGLQVLDGQTALKYARTRHGDNDFQRAERQQAVMYAIRDKLLDPAHLPELVIQSPGLWAALQDGIYTDLTLEQSLQLALYLKDIPGGNVRTGVIDDRYAIDYTTPEGAQVLVPDRERLSELLIRVFGATTARKQPSGETAGFHSCNGPARPCERTVLNLNSQGGHPGQDSTPT